MSVDTSVTIGNVEFSNPVFVASGTFGYGVETDELVDVNRLGAIVTKSITPQPREGNPPPRMVETPSGMINSIGLANIGVERYIGEMLPLYESFKTKIITNIAGFSVSDYAEVMEKLEQADGSICAYEINISCPNVEGGKMEFAVDAGMTLTLTKELRQRTEKLLIIKLSPSVTDIGEIAKAAEDGGADAVSAINTVFGMSIDTSSQRFNIATGIGGLSGPAIRPIGVACVHMITSAVSIPVIGMGGITSGSDAVEYMLAGASAVQVGTANYRDPAAGLTVLDEMITFCDEHGFTSLSQLAGALKDES